MKAAVIVAHPDDETIWSGGFILKHPDWEWTILSLCRADDPDRRPKFQTVCNFLNARAVILDLDDSNPLEPIDPGKDISSRILNEIGEEEWGLVLTHGENGEYGHPRHIEVHSEVVKLCESGLLMCSELLLFAYECAAGNGQCKPAQIADYILELSERELAEKKRIINEIYGYDQNSFEVNACISPESFIKINLSKG